MIKWFIERENKVPLYLQLKDLIKFYISTGAIKDNYQLPGVNTLGQELGINFDTVRKAYKELEKEGLLSMKRGMGTVVTLHKSFIPETGPKKNFELGIHLEPIDVLKRIIRKLLQDGKNLEEVKEITDKALNEISSECPKQFIIFTECNLLQINEISHLLREYLNLDVKPVLLKDLKDEVQRIFSENHELLAIVTTGFHMNEVQNIVGDRGVDIHLLITNMSPEARNQLNNFDKNSRFGFICRDRESIPLYTDLLKAELDSNLNLSSCILEEESKVHDILKSVDVLLATPPVYEEIKKSAPSGFPIFNVFDRVDPMSLRLVKDYIFRKLNQ